MKIWVGLAVLAVALVAIWMPRSSTNQLKSFTIWVRRSTGWHEVGCQFAMESENVNLDFVREKYKGCSILVLEPWDMPWVARAALP